MLTDQKLYELARCRFEEAKILLTNHKPDGSVYLCGYAIELILKRRIVKLLEWDGYPESTREFENYKSFKVHDLDVLLRLSGLEKKIQADDVTFARWQIAHTWDSEVRYKEIGKILETEAQDIINATRQTINFVLRHG
jgi:hypothetical protein